MKRRKMMLISYQDIYQSLKNLQTYCIQLFLNFDIFSGIKTKSIIYLLINQIKQKSSTI